MSMDATAVKAIQESSAILAVAGQIPSVSQQKPLIALSSDTKLENMEKYFPYRRAFRGNMVTNIITAFVKFCESTANDGAACFVNAEKMAANAIFNYSSVDGMSAGHCDFGATLTLDKTAELRAYLDAGSRQWTQLELAHFLEDNAEIVTAYTGQADERESLGLVRAIKAIRKITIDSASRGTSEVQDMRSSRTALETIAASSDTDVLPSYFVFKFVPYVGLQPRELAVRLVVHFSGSEPKLSLKLVQWEQQKQLIADEFAELLNNLLDGLIERVYTGTFNAQ